MDEFVPCDSCGVRSFVYATLKSGRELSYCAHHGQVAHDGLLAAGARIIDLRHLVEA